MPKASKEFKDIAGLVACVFAILIMDKLIGLSDISTATGMVIGSGSYIIMLKKG